MKKDFYFPFLEYDCYEDGTVILRYPLSNIPPKIVEGPGVKPVEEPSPQVPKPEVSKPTYKERRCKRCGATWTPRKKQKPVQCPKCKSPYWNKKRVYQKR
jgi:DNA-directed RNA polymerase subunit RPC12/RpoP